MGEKARFEVAPPHDEHGSASTRIARLSGPPSHPLRPGAATKRTATTPVRPPEWVRSVETRRDENRPRSHGGQRNRAAVQKSTLSHKPRASEFSESYAMQKILAKVSGHATIP